MLTEMQERLLRQILRKQGAAQSAQQPSSFGDFMKSARDLAADSEELSEAEQRVLADYEASIVQGPPRPAIKPAQDR